jgi:hypothetical protein
MEKMEDNRLPKRAIQYRFGEEVVELALRLVTGPTGLNLDTTKEDENVLC